jgi:hypothetical protein
MRYKNFSISHYRGIKGPLTIDLGKSLMPIIGVNECGKTTILKAIFSFDYHNDSLNENIKHLDDIYNLYETSPLPPEISAEIEISVTELKSIINQFEKDAAFQGLVKTYKRSVNKITNSITLTRNLAKKEYSIRCDFLKNVAFNDAIAKAILRSLPYILFFDDFRDSIQEKIEIKSDEDNNITGWLAIIDKLFQTTNQEYNVLDLPGKEERTRKSILSQINKTLEKSLTREWQNFRLDDKEALKINIDYKEEVEDGKKRYYLKFDVIETDQNGHEHYFFIGDRSKGFYWFFNFVMKLEFNPKVLEGSIRNAIYLLDEPGSYLHALAQSKLCKKLKQLSEKNEVIYCTHSHYLLDPETIPINSVKVAVKDPNQFGIDLKSIYDYQGNIIDKRSAFQPIIDALQIKPIAFDLNHNGKTIITEGIYDYYCLDMFKTTEDIGFLPSVNAESIKYYISIMISIQKDYRALWDNDIEGKKEKDLTTVYFGDEEAKKFILLSKGSQRKVIMQDMFEGTDLKLIKSELGIPTNSSFEKTILTWYYSKSQKVIFSKISGATKENFQRLYNLF